MTVQELIEELQKLDQNKRVYAWDSDGFYGDIDEIVEDDDYYLINAE